MLSLLLSVASTEIQLKLVHTNEGEVLAYWTIRNFDSGTFSIFKTSSSLLIQFISALTSFLFRGLFLSVEQTWYGSYYQLFSYYLAFSFQLALSYYGNPKGTKKLLTLLYIAQGRFLMSLLDLPSPCTNPCGWVVTVPLIEVAGNSFLNGKNVLEKWGKYFWADQNNRCPLQSSLKMHIFIGEVPSIKYYVPHITDIRIRQTQV